MDTRSNNYGFASPKNIISNVASSHGVMLSGGSTGGVVEAIGDDANVSLTVRGRGTGRVVVGSTAATVVFNSTTVTFGSASTTPIAAIQRYVVQFTPPQLAANSAEDSTFTVVGATTNAVYVFTESNAFSTKYTLTNVRCSTADEVVMRFSNNAASTIGNGESTNRGVLLQFSF